MGITFVADLAANAACGLPVAAINATCLRTNSAASASSRSLSPFRPAVFDGHVLALDVAGVPQTQTKSPQTVYVLVSRRRIKETDDAAAAPPSSVMNSRRFLSNMGLPPLG
jgi:hypothetical protein